MESIEFSQEELILIINVFNACNIKLGDAVVMLPIANKIRDKIHPAPTVPENTPIPPSNHVDATPKLEELAAEGEKASN